MRRLIKNADRSRLAGLLDDVLGPHRFRRPAIAALIILGVAPAALANKKPNLLKLKTQPIVLQAQPLTAFQRINPLRSSFGPLTFRGGAVITSPSDYFGGLSGLTITPDGKNFLAVTDAGAWMTASLSYRGKTLVGVEGGKIGQLRARRDKPLRRGKDRDAEAIQLMSGSLQNGRALISFERNHRVGVFPIAGGVLKAPTSYLGLPKGYKKGMTRNKGFEAVGLINGGPDRGKVIVVAERAWKAGEPLKGWIFPARKRRQARAIEIRKIDDFDVTDLVTLRDGSVILLERKFRFLEGVKMRLRRLSPAELMAPGQIDGQILFEANQSYQIDNMEGLAAHREADGTLVLTMISDDNFNAFQRTILLQFALKEDWLEQVSQ